MWACTNEHLTAAVKAAGAANELVFVEIARTARGVGMVTDRLHMEDVDRATHRACLVFFDDAERRQLPWENASFLSGHQVHLATSAA